MRKVRLRRLATILLLTTPLPAVCAGVSAAPATTRVAQAIAATYAARNFEQVALSPDGRSVAWVETLVGSDGVPDGHTQIYVADAKDGGQVHRITASGRRAAEGSVTWAPDSSRVAFTSDAAKPGQPQLYTARPDGGQVRRITNIDGALANRHDDAVAGACDAAVARTGFDADGQPHRGRRDVTPAG